MCIKCFSRWRDKYISSLLYSICQGLNSFFSFKTKKKTLFDMFKNMSVVSFSIKTVWTPILGSGLMVSGIDLMFTFYSKIFLSLQQEQSEVHITPDTCTTDYFRCAKYEVHDRVCKHIRCTKCCVPRFLILKALYLISHCKKLSSWIKNNP